MTKIKETPKNSQKINHKNIWLCMNELKWLDWEIKHRTLPGCLCLMDCWMASEFGGYPIHFMLFLPLG